MPPPQPHVLKRSTFFPDAIFAAASLLLLLSTSPKSIMTKLSCPLNLRRFPKMSAPFSSHPYRRSRGRLPPPFVTPQSLSDWLRPRLSADLFGSWGVKRGTKNVHSLWLEIVEGETLLADSVPPVRTVEVVVVRIVRNDGKVLIESHQEMSNGAVRHRCRPLSEKMKPRESIESAVYRAVKEELGSLAQIDKENGDGISGIQERVKILPGSYVKKVEERVSASYPGLPACYVLHTVNAEVEGLPEDEFCTEEVNEYGAASDSAVSCRKHFWKWVDFDSI